MKHVLLLSAFSITLLTGCSTAFKTGQTPDDVYFSPGREIVQDERVQEKQKAEYQDYVSSMDDRYLRMKISNRSRWSSIDNFDYWYDSRYDFGNYNYQYYSGLSPYWSPRLGYGAYYPGNYGNYGWGWNSPVYTVVHYYTIPSTPGGFTSGSNITAYRNKSYNNNNYGYRDPKTGGFMPGNGSSNFGSLLKRVFTRGGTDNAYSYDRPARTFSNTPGNNPSTPTPPPSSSAGGNSGGFKSTGTSTSTGRGGRG